MRWLLKAFSWLGGYFMNLYYAAGLGKDISLKELPPKAESVGGTLWSHAKNYFKKPILWRRRFDSIFLQHASIVPLPYCRALSWMESSMDETNTKGGAWGLMEITNTVVRSYNKGMGTKYKRRNVLDPVINVKMFAYSANTIRKVFARYPNVNLKWNWDNPRFVELFTTSWNSGIGAVDRMVKYLNRHGKSVNIDNVFAYRDAARKAGSLSKTQWEVLAKRKKSWQVQVPILYYRIAEETPPDGPTLARGTGSFKRGPTALGIFAALGLLFVRLATYFGGRS